MFLQSVLPANQLATANDKQTYNRKFIYWNAQTCIAENRVNIYTVKHNDTVMTK